MRKSLLVNPPLVGGEVLGVGGMVWEIVMELEVLSVCLVPSLEICASGPAFVTSQS